MIYKLSLDDIHAFADHIASRSILCYNHYMKDAKEDKIFLFISHSHQDLEKVRCVRNYVEKLNAEPILFFLKSLSDKDQITQLIKDEIDARIWFIYCRSQNAERSNWVRTELDHVFSTGKQNLLEIDLESDVVKGALTQEAKLRILNSFHSIRQNTYFFASFSQRDKYIVYKIMEYLKQYGISIFSPIDGLSASGCWEAHIKQTIQTSPFFLWFVSENTISSPAVNAEFEYAGSLNKVVLPIVLTSKDKPTDFLSSKDMPLMAALYLKENPYFRFDIDAWQRSANELINHIIMRYESL